ncbi:MAG: hypothetical protein KC503_38745 [Myxococcales bacterium]|nr:hypothetical protein [Myxococcales bacterium]
MARLALALALLLCLAVPSPASAADLDVIYARAARDIQAGKPLVVTVHVALCDNRSLACGGGGLGNGDVPKRNLYWGGGAGLRAFFDHLGRGFRRVHVDAGDKKRVLERVVYRMRVKRPSARWRRLGVTQPFDVYLVGLAWRGRAIGGATRAFVDEVAGVAAARALTLRSGLRLRFGSASHVVGYAGHNHMMDVLGYRFPKVKRRAAVGYFALSCINARYLAPLRAAATRALLLTRVLMYPGAFTAYGLVRGFARAEPAKRVYQRGVFQYARYQKRTKRLAARFFTR